MARRAPGGRVTFDLADLYAAFALGAGLALILYGKLTARRIQRLERMAHSATMAWDELAIARRHAALEQPAPLQDGEQATVEAICEDMELATENPYLTDEQRRAIILRRHQEAHA